MACTVRSSAVAAARIRVGRMARFAVSMLNPTSNCTALPSVPPSTC